MYELFLDDMDFGVEMYYEIILVSLGLYVLWWLFCSLLEEWVLEVEDLDGLLYYECRIKYWNVVSLFSYFYFGFWYFVLIFDGNRGNGGYYNCK